jgi:hypothetical protein
MHTEEFDYLICRAAQSFIPSSEAEIEVGWQQLLAISGGMDYQLDGAQRQLGCVDLPGPHGRLAAGTSRAQACINSQEGVPTQ